MPAAFYPQRIIAEILAGAWPLYEEIFQRAKATKRSRVLRLAEGLYAFQIRESASNRRNNPVAKNIETRAEAFLKENHKALGQNQKGYLRALSRAQALLDTGKWPITLRGLIILAIIHLREEDPRPRIDLEKLRKIVTAHRKVNESFWYRSLNHPDIVFLLQRSEDTK